MTYYTPLFRRQIGDPTTNRDGYICTMTSGAMVLDYHTLGGLQLWGGELERHQNQHTGGTDLNDLALAWAYYGQVLTIQSGYGWAGVRRALGEGRAVVLQGDYDRFTGANSCQKGFADPHAIALLPSDTAWAIVGDPLCSGFKVIAEGTVRAYAEKLAPRVHFAVSRPQSSIVPPPTTEEPMNLRAVKGEDWTPALTRRPYRPNPERGGPITGYIELGTIVRTIAEATTKDGNNWRLTEINGVPAWLLRADFNPVVQGGDPAVDAGLTNYIERKG